jgi:histidinol-phosphatase
MSEHGAMDRVMETAIEAARAAGEVAMKYYRGSFDVEIKPDRTPVTQADREAERIITEHLRRAFPDHGFLGEEFGAQGPKEVRWLIDPIDGTRNFVRRIPFWAVLLALEEHGEITAGVTHNPVTGELYYARKGAGAYANGERIRVSTAETLAEAFLCHASLNLIRRAGYWEGMVRLIDATERQRGWGEYYGYAAVAKGQAEISVEADLKPWDMGPMKILVEEAGGRFTDFRGVPTIYTGTALATNGRLHDSVLACLGPDRQ